MDSLQELKYSMREFARARDWEQFHSPKNLSMALAGEAGELLECFQWLSEQDSYALDTKQKDAVADEISDVLLFLVMLADKLDINMLAAARNKIGKNANKYPIEKVKGNPKKYTEY